MGQGNRPLETPDIRVEGCTKQLGATRVLKDVSFEVFPGEFVSMLGPSGCGKTTTLRIIGGFLKCDSGDVYIRGVRVTSVPAYRRNIGMVFQSYALWPHMTVFNNIAFGLRLRKLPRMTVAERVKQALGMVGLERMVERYPRELSGGEQQRVSLARALATDPSVLLLDEPLSNLDRKLREQMRVELKSLQQSLGITSLYVTHDQEEALSLSDRVIVMKEGEIQQVGPSREIYERPANAFVADFVGHANLLEGEVVEQNNDEAVVRLPSGIAVRAKLLVRVLTGGRAVVLVRPEKVTITGKSSITGVNHLRATVKQGIFEGATLRYALTLGGFGQVFFAHGLSGQTLFQPGDDVDLEIQEAAVVSAPQTLK